MANLQTRKSPTAIGLDVALNSNLRAQNSSNDATDIELPPWRLVRHTAALLDVAVGLLCTGHPISITGRMVLADLADRLRKLSEALK